MVRCLFCQVPLLFIQRGGLSQHLLLVLRLQLLLQHLLQLVSLLFSKMAPAIELLQLHLHSKSNLDKASLPRTRRCSRSSPLSSRSPHGPSLLLTAGKQPVSAPAWGWQGQGCKGMKNYSFMAMLLG